MSFERSPQLTNSCFTVSRGSAYTVVMAMHESMGNDNFGVSELYNQDDYIDN